MSETANGSSEKETLSHGYQYDLFVIGAGSGGVRASRIAANHGARVAVAENGPLGGTCVNVGCVPKKLFVYGSHYSNELLDARSYGWDTKEPTLNWSRLISNKNDEIKRLNGIYGKMLDKADVKLIRGTAKFVDPHTIEIEGTQYTADKILIATGGGAFVPNIEGREHIITSDDAFYLKELPKRVVIVGGGYIAVEFTCIFHGYGVEVTQLYRRDLFLRGFDEDLRKHLADQMHDQGIDVRFKLNIDKVVKNDEGTYTAHLDDGSTMETDLVMFATGRKPNTKALCLDNAGVKVGDGGEVVVDEWNQTNVNHIYAIGDVTDRIQLTPVAIAEGQAFADNVFGGKERKISYENVPTAVFASPPMGTCGLTEDEARDKYGEDGIDVYMTTFRPMKHTMTKREGQKTLMKLIVDRKTDKVIGCHMLDESAPDLIQLIGVCIQAGATKAHFDSTIAVHPVSAEELVTLKTKKSES